VLDEDCVAIMTRVLVGLLHLESGTKCLFLLIVVCVNLWNECVHCNMGGYTDFIFHVDHGALSTGLFFFLGEWGGR